MGKVEFGEIQKIQFKDLSLFFDDGGEIFNKVSFNFPSDECVWVKSRAGRGKTVFLKLLLGLMLPTDGDYLINQKSVGNMSFSEFLPFRINIGYSFDFGGLLSNKTIKQNLSLPLEYHNVLSEEEKNDRVNEFLKMFNLFEVKDRRPSAVTGGVRKAACVARSLILKPQMLLLDEPTAGLRNEPREALMDYIKKEFSSGHLKHVFVTSHDQNFLDFICTKTLKIDKSEFELMEYERFEASRKVGNL